MPPRIAVPIGTTRGRFPDFFLVRPHPRPCLVFTPTKSGFDLPSPYEFANVFEQTVNLALGFAEGSFVNADLNLAGFEFLLYHHGQVLPQVLHRRSHDLICIITEICDVLGVVGITTVHTILQVQLVPQHLCLGLILIACHFSVLLSKVVLSNI